MIYLLYLLWIMAPLSYLLMLLWAWLEGRGKRERRSDLNDLWHQLLFLTGCVIAAFIIDLYLLDHIYRSVVPEFIPKGLLQVLLLPAILSLAAPLVGGSEPIRAQGKSSRRRPRR